MTANDANRTPLDHALDVLVYLPVGFMFELPRAIPRFIERGRRELGVDGGAADDGPGFEPENALDRVQAHAIGTLRALGVLPGERHRAEPDEHETAPPATGPQQAPSTAEPGPTGAGASANGSGIAEPRAEAIDVDALAIPGYDSLSASQVMPRLESLSADELELVRRYEHANRGRKTILNKIAQLQA